MINDQIFGAAMVLYLVATVLYVVFVVSRGRAVGVAA